MTTPEREGLLGDIVDKLKDAVGDGEPRPQVPEEPCDEDVDGPLVPRHPLTHHDSERLLPPPVAGTID